MKNAITDVQGIKVGNVTDLKALTGCTVVLCEFRAVAGIDVRGGAATTRGIDSLKPMNLVEEIHGVVLTGGSAFGLDAVGGVMEYLEEKGMGFDVGITKVPIVPAAVIFDLWVGDSKVRPDKKIGYQACLNATDGKIEEGNIGAGTGATVGKLLGIKGAMKGGLGTASQKIKNDIVVGALVVANAFGDVIDPEEGRILAGVRSGKPRRLVNTAQRMKEGLLRKSFAEPNTTIGVVATNAKLTREQANKVAQLAHNGLAKVISPVHTMYDGDAIFALSIGERKADVDTIGLVAAEVIAEAIVRAIKNAEGIPGIPAYRDIHI